MTGRRFADDVPKSNTDIEMKPVVFESAEGKIVSLMRHYLNHNRFTINTCACVTITKYVKYNKKCRTNWVTIVLKCYEFYVFGLFFD